MHVKANGSEWKQDFAIALVSMFALTALIPTAGAVHVAGDPSSNQLTVDGSQVDPITGLALITSWENRGSTRTTVVVINPGGAPTYALQAPNGVNMFSNQGLTETGAIYFPDIPVLSYIGWRVLGSSGGPLFNFNIPGGFLWGDGCWYVYDVVYTRNLWTNILVAHAPSAGTASASTSTAKASYIQYDFEAGATVSYGKKVTSSSHSDLGTNDGRTTGYFRLAQWAEGTAQQWCTTQQGVPYENGPAKPVVWVNEWKSSTYSGMALYGLSTLTDTDDKESITHNGYESTTLKNRFSAAEDYHEHDGVGTFTQYYHRERNIYVGGRVQIETEIYTVAMALRYDTTSSQHYTVTYDDPVCVAIDWLGTETSMRPAFTTLSPQECTSQQAPQIDGLPELPIPGWADPL